MPKTKELPRWDLTNVYPALDSKDFKADSTKFIQQLDELKDYLEEHNISSINQVDAENDAGELANIIGGLLDRLNDAILVGGTLGAYLYAHTSTDSYNDEAKRLQSKLQQQLVRLTQQETEIQAWVGSMGDKLSEVIAGNPSATAHAFYLNELAEQSKFLMSGAEESLAAELSLSGGSAWKKLQEALVSQKKVEFEVDGKLETLPITALIYYRTNPDEPTRKRAYEAESAAWKTIAGPLAACMNGIKGEVNTLNKRRGRQDAVHTSIDQSRIDRETLEAMLDAMKDSLPMFRKYFVAKAKRLGKEKLAWWDLSAPMGKIERSFTYPEACAYVVEKFNTFSPKLASYAQHAVDNNWLDVGGRDGKVAGAYCMDIPSVQESRIMLNFEEDLDWVFTIAHELGHGFHNECAKDKTQLQQNTPMTLAETASTMCESILTDAAIAEAKSEEEELAILESDLIGASGVVVDIYSRYLFETEVFERRAKAELSVDDLNDIMKRTQIETYGDGLDENYLQQYMWTWKPHYYSTGISFYNYPYAFGLLFATGLYAIYQKQGDSFVDDYIDLLASTGEANAADLAARFDIDIRSPKFWEDSLGVIGKRIDRYIEL